jgi:hypothetical protein
MRAAGGAWLGLAACALACVSAWKPPPEPPPPAPAAETPSKYNPFRGLEWNATTRALACGQAEFTLSADLAAHVRTVGANELVIVPAGSPPGGALMARAHDDAGAAASIDRGGGFGGLLGLLVWGATMLVEHVTLGHEYEAMVRLHELASGTTLERANVVADVKMNDDLLEIAYTVDDARAQAWRLVGLEGDRCSIMLIERVRPDSTHHFTEIETKLRAAALSFDLARNPQRVPNLRRWAAAGRARLRPTRSSRGINRPASSCRRPRRPGRPS